MDSEKLIHEVRIRKLLWDTKSGNYKDKKKVKDAWDEVGKALNCDGEAAKKKWRSLRNNYTQERNKMNKQFKSGSGSLETYVSKWRFFADMDFLRSVITPAESTSNLDNSLYEEAVIDESQHAYPEIKEENDSNSSQNIEFEEDQNTLVETEMSPPRKKRFNKNISRELELVELEKEKLNLLKKKDECRNDGDYHFLMSFLPYMHQMSRYKNAQFRLKMSQLLVETLESDKP